MKRMKRLTAVALCVLILLGTIPASTLAFTDISDPAVARSAEFLRRLGVVSGVGGDKYAPEQYLTRAQFCVIAVNILDPAFNKAKYSSYTKFPDVRASHWAHPWINAAVEHSLVVGLPDGTFGPDKVIDFQAAVTILMRMLSYSEDDVGLTWPSNYINHAKLIGLTDGISRSPKDPFTRGDAALLFCNLLYLPVNGGSGTLLSKFKITTREIFIISTSQTMPDGKTPALLTGDGELIPYDGAASSFKRFAFGTATFDKNGKIIDFLPNEAKSETITVQSVSSTSFTSSYGRQFTVSASIKVYSSSGSGTFGTAWSNIFAGETLTVFYNNNGSIDYIAREKILINGYEADSRLETFITDVTLFMPDGKTPAVMTLYGDTFPCRVKLPVKDAFTNGVLAFDSDNYVIGFEPGDDQRAVVTVASVSGNSVTGTDGKYYPIGDSALVYTIGERVTSDTFKLIWIDVLPGEQFFICYTKSGTVDYIVRRPLNSGSYVLAVIPQVMPRDPVTSAFGSRAISARIYKNGVLCSVSDLSSWDVMMYYPATNVVKVSNRRVTGTYASGTPVAAPDTVTVMGQSFLLLAEAKMKINSFKRGSDFTLLLADDGRVADIQPTSAVSSSMFGYVTDVGSGTATIETPYGESFTVATNNARLWSMVRFYEVSGNGIVSVQDVVPGTSDINLETGTMGTGKVLPYCVFYEAAALPGLMVPADVSSLKSIPRSRILHVQTDGNGRAEVVVLKDTSYSTYMTGRLTYKQVTTQGSGLIGPQTRYVIELNGTSYYLNGPIANPPPSGAIGGLAVTLINGEEYVADYYTCFSHTLSRYNFNSSNAVIAGVTVPIAEGVMVYDPSAGSYISIDDARMLYDIFTVYTDPEWKAVRYIEVKP